MTRHTVLVVEPFNAGSHRAWAEGWQNNSRHRIHIVSHGGRAWRWRMRGGAVTLAEEVVDWVEANGCPDLLVGTDMLDLGAFLGLTRRVLGSVPTAIYMHENQLTYPRQPGEPLDQGLAWANWRSLVAADEIWCNSSFHRDSLLGALPDLLLAVPDHDHGHLMDGVGRKMSVCPVGLDALRLTATDRLATLGPPLVLSNQRWHHDNDVGAVLRALNRLAGEGIEFDLAVVGDDAAGEGEVLAPLIDKLGRRVCFRGHLPRPDYETVLRRADVVVSAARNEFFGIAVAEAVAAGAWPVLPASLAYPDLIPPEFHQVSLYEQGGLTRRLRQTIEAVVTGRAAIEGLADSLRRFDWSVVAAGYDDRIDRLVQIGVPPRK